MAFVAGVAASSAALQGGADPGVVAEGPGGRVSFVSTAGFAWRDGIRVGQIVVAVSSTDEDTGWRLETVADGQTVVSRSEPANAALRESLPLAVAGLVAGGLAVLFLRTRRHWVLPAASLALLAASTSLALYGHAEISGAVLAAACLVPGISLSKLAPWSRPPKLAAGATLVGGVVVWLAARLTGADAYDPLEQVRSVAAIVASFGLFAERVVVPSFVRDPIRMSRPALFDIAAVAVLTAIALALVNVWAVSPIVTGLLLLVAIAATPAIRRRVGRPIEDMLLADVRAHAEADGAERERTRMARELHDVPLQELTAVIRRLEILPSTEAARDDLTTLAAHLRDVASELRPPVLDDFGLPAAIEYLADETSCADLAVVANVTDGTGFGPAQRPPAEVELAMYRIAREAVTNAVRHSGATAVAIRAAVTPDRVEVVVSDNGSGFDGEAARDAGRRKHFGLSSIRRSAQAIDAELNIDGTRDGTMVHVSWQR